MSQRAPVQVYNPSVATETNPSSQVPILFSINGNVTPIALARADVQQVAIVINGPTHEPGTNFFHQTAHQVLTVSPGLSRLTFLQEEHRELTREDKACLRNIQKGQRLRLGSEWLIKREGVWDPSFPRSFIFKKLSQPRALRWVPGGTGGGLLASQAEAPGATKGAGARAP